MRYRGRVGANGNGSMQRNPQAWVNNAGQIPNGGGQACFQPPWPPEMNGCDTNNPARKCFTQLGGEAVTVAAGVAAPVTLTPVNLSVFVPMTLLVVAYEDATNTRIFNGVVDNVAVFGNTGLASGLIPLDRFGPQMPYLEWQGQGKITPQNPGIVTVRHFITATNVTFRVSMDGMGYQ